MIWKVRRSGSPTPHPRIPDHLRVYAVGDIHGRLDLLDCLLAQIESDSRHGKKLENLYVFLGDYIDRGPASGAVIERLITFCAGRAVAFLKGNHEKLLLDFFEKPDVLQNWSRHGGLDTLLSYGLHPPARPDAAQCAKIAGELRDAMPEDHKYFLHSLSLSWALGDFFFVHAGVRPNIALEKQAEEDLLWIREDFISCKQRFDKMIVHGHTPVSKPEVHPNRINIDTGAYATGQLTCLVIEGKETRFLQAM